MDIHSIARNAVKKKRANKTLEIIFLHQTAWLDDAGWHCSDLSVAEFLNKNLAKYTPFSQSPDPLWDYANEFKDQYDCQVIYLRPIRIQPANPDFIY